MARIFKPKSPADVASLARSHTATAIKTLAGIMNHPRADLSARIAACRELLSRGWGQPMQKNESDVTHHYVIEVPPVLTSSEWAKRYGSQSLADEIERGKGPLQ
jgi:hypothetical protein